MLYFFISQEKQKKPASRYTYPQEIYNHGPSFDDELTDLNYRGLSEISSTANKSE